MPYLRLIEKSGHIMYLPDGRETTDVEEFISFYSEKYLSDNPKNTKEL